MNYIWELAIKALNEDLDADEIVYKFGAPFSAYMELSFIHMNEKEVIFEVEINPYYRYYAIFKELFEPNLIDNSEVREAVLDLTIHHLKDIDVFMGMNKREYYIKFIVFDMQKGFFGKYISERMESFKPSEQKIVANNVLKLYETGENIFLFRETIMTLFTNSYVFSNQFDKDEITLYLRTKETEDNVKKVELVKHIFLPFNYNIEVFWELIFGIMGVDDFMKTGSMLNH